MLRCLLRQRPRPAAAIASLRSAGTGALRPPLSQIHSSRLPLRLYATKTSSKTSSSISSTSPSATLANKRRDECLRALEAFQKDNKAVESVALLQQMVAAAPGDPGSPPPLPLSVFQNALETCKEAMDAPSALEVLRLMQQQGHHLDGKIYSTAIGACARGGDVAAIEGLLAEMKGGGTGTQPQLTHYYELARGYRAAKQGRKALALLNAAMNKVEEEGGEMITLNDRFYAEVLGACGAEGLILEASMLLEALVEEKKTQGLPLRPIIFGQFMFEVATADRLAGKWKTAWSVCEKVRGYEMDLTPIAFSGLVRCLSEAQQYGKIVELCHELLASPSFSSVMRREEHRINFFNSAVQAAGAIPDHAQVLQFIKASISSPPLPPEEIGNESSDISDSNSNNNSISSKSLFHGYNACLALRDVEALRFLIDHSLASFAAAPSRRNKFLTAALQLGQWQEMQRIFATVGQQAGQEEDTYELYRLMAVGAARLGPRPVEDVGPFLDEIESRGWILAPSLQQRLRMPAHQQQQQQQQQQQHYYQPQQPHVAVASELLKRLGRDGWREALQVLKRMEQVIAATATSSVPASFHDASEEQLSTTDGAFADATTKLTTVAFKSAASTYERIMAAAGYTGYTEATWSIYNTMQRWGVPISPMGYNTLLYRCSQTGEVSRARALFKSMLHRQRKKQQAHAQGQGPGQGRGSGGSSSAAGNSVHEAPTLVNYNTMLRVLAKQGEFAEAKALLASMPEPDIVSYNTVLSAGAETGNWEGTCAFLREMERAADQKEGVAPDIISYNTTLSALKQQFFAAPSDSKFNPWEKGVALLHDLRKKGLAPDAMTFNILIDLGCRTGQVDQARALLPVMHRQGERPDSVTTNTLGYGYIQAGRYADALSHLEELMPGKDFVNSRYTCVIAFTALAGLKRDKEVEAFFWQLLEQKGGNDRSGSSRSSSKVKDPAPTDFQGVMQMLLTGMAQVGRVDDGVALMASLEGRMAAAAGGGGAAAAAAPARRPVSSSRITEEVFQPALQMCKGKSNLEGALTLLREMEKRGLKPTVGRSLEPVLRLASMLGEWKKGLELVEAAWQHTPTLRKERALHKHRIVYYSYLGDLLGCRKAFAEMQAEGIQPDAVCYGRLLRCEVERDDNRKRLRDLLKRVREEKLGMTQELASVHLLTFKKLQDWRGALLFFDGIVKEQERRERGQKGLRITTRMVNNVLDTLAQCGEWERLLALVEKMEARFGTKPDNVSYLQHLNALGQLARLEEAMSIFERLRAGEFGDEVGPRREMYTNLMAAFARWGRVDQTERLFAMQKDDAIPNTQHSVNSLMIAYARCGQMGEAIKTFESIPSLLGEAPDLVAYNVLINAHRLEGTPLQEGGLLLYRDLLAQGLAPDASTYTPLIHSCQEEGLWPVAMYLLEESRFAMSSSLTAGATAALRGKAAAAEEEAEASGGKEEAEERDTEVQWGRAGSRLDIVKTTIGCLDRMGVDLFAQEVYMQGYHEGLFNHWLTVMGEQVMDFHVFSRPMAKAAIHCALEEMVSEGEQQLARPRAVRKALIHPWIIIVGQGRSSAVEGKSVLRREVINVLAKVEPPLEAETDPANPGRLLVHQRQLRVYVKAAIDKKVKTREQEGWRNK